MVAYKNVFETPAEANMRLEHTVVLYDGEPYYVLCITDHKEDGIFRIYLDPLTPDGTLECHIKSIPYQYYDEEDGDESRGEVMDEWLDVNPGTKVIRKTMNSPAFKMFRPFPLGMGNYGTSAYYIQWQPTRSTYQGLTDSNLYTTQLGLKGPGPSLSKIRCGDSVPRSVNLYNVIKGIYPSFDECWDALKNPEIENDTAAFAREFAITRGPVGLILLYYKTDIVGLVEKDKKVNLSREFGYTKEVIESLGIFSGVEVKE